jgi:predicted Rossmann fold nucleotide-binding protein DprA/Smf involved in DNA uptake
VPDEVLQGLDPLQKLLLESIPDDGTVTVDSLTNLGYPYGQIVSALTMLEIEGLLEKLPGALYKKA